MSGKQRMLDMSDELDDQLDRIKQMNRTANQTQETSNNIMRELGDQREKMTRQVDMVYFNYTFYRIKILSKDSRMPNRRPMR